MKAFRSGLVDEALDLTRSFSETSLPPSAVQPVGRLARLLAGSKADLPILRIAFGASSTIDDLIGLATWKLLLNGVRLESFIAPYNTWGSQIRDSNSDLRKFEPQLTWQFSDSSAFTVEDWLPANTDHNTDKLSRALKELETESALSREFLGAQIIVCNLPANPWRILGNFEPAVKGSPAQTVQAYNLALSGLLPAGSSVFDLAHIAASYGLLRWHDERLWYHSKHPFSLEAHSLVAAKMANHVLTLRGQSRKCLVLDLDNTLWGGVVGDDGPEGIVVGRDAGATGEAFFAFQNWVKALSLRGIVLAVCSKNDPLVARTAFEARPEMPLKLDDFAVFQANWANKADNIRAIASELNLGLDSIVFVDDNPAERELVRSVLPQVAVPEMPENPAHYIRMIAACGWFETTGLSTEDLLRTQAYQQNAARQLESSGATDLEAYLQGLLMTSKWGSVTSSSLTRATQLLNKTNQFNLMASKHTEQEIECLLGSRKHFVAQFQLEDRFGQHGLTSVAILEFTENQTAVITAWAMSCRVFARTFEQFIFNKLAELASARGCVRLVGQYRPSNRNTVVANLYLNLGGKPQLSTTGEYTWTFTLNHWSDLPTSISDTSPKP
jgi:FkbH-like protein